MVAEIWWGSIVQKDFTILFCPSYVRRSFVPTLGTVQVGEVGQLDGTEALSGSGITHDEMAARQ